MDKPYVNFEPATKSELEAELEELRKEALVAGEADIVKEIDQLGTDASDGEIADIKMALDGWLP